MAKAKDPNKLSVAKFAEVTGMIEDAAELKRELKKLPRGLYAKVSKEIKENGAIDAHGRTHILLMQVTEKLPELHIITTTDSDDGKSLVFDNCVRRVNRIDFYLGKGDKKSELYCTERRN